MRKRETKPMVAAAFVLALALGSAIVWVLFAAPASLAAVGDPDWWPGLYLLPHR